MQRLLQQTINGLSIGGVYALLGLGVTLVWGVLRVLNFAHAQILTWGAFGSFVMINRGYPIPVAVVAGLAVASVISLVLDGTVIAALRRRSASEFSTVVATIGFSVILEAILRQRTDAEIKGYPRRGLPTGSFKVGDISVPWLQLTILGVALVVMVLLSLWMNRTKLGRALRTVAHSSETAELLGVNSRALFSLAFVISGALAALAGVFIAASTSTISYSMGHDLILIAFAVIVLGGMGSVKGAIVGGLALGVAEVYATVYVSSVFREAVAMIAILAVLLLRPQGLFGEPEVARV